MRPYTISRRTLLAGALAAGAGALAACGGSSKTASSGKDPLTIVTWGGTTQEGIKRSVADPFTKQTGIPTKVIAPVDYGKLKAQVQAGKVTWDWIDIESWFPYAQPDLLEPLDYNVIKVKEDDLLTLPGAPSPLQPWGVGGGSYAFVIAYRTDHSGPRPRSWAEFFDPKAIPGKRAVYNWPYGMVEAALLSDGVAFKDLYPLDLDRAFKKLDSVRSSLVFWNSGAELQQLLANGTVPFAYAWHNRVAYLARNKTPVAIEWAQNICDGGGAHIVLKRNPRKAEVMKFIDFALQPENDRDLSVASGYSPSTKAGLKMIPQDYLQWLNIHEPNLAQAAGTINAEWWGKNMDMVTKKWSAWAAA